MFVEKTDLIKKYFSNNPGFINYKINSSFYIKQSLKQTKMYES